MATKYLILASVILVISFLYYAFTTLTSKSDMEIAIERCIALCKEYKANNTDLSFGPCLSNNILDDWVCDVAHRPREIIDNDPRNQCLDYRLGKKHHFVEVDPDCNFIRAV